MVVQTIPSANTRKISKMPNEEEFKNLKSEQYYSDLYDRGTIEECRRWEESGMAEAKKAEEKEKKESKTDKIRVKFKGNIVLPVALYFIQGERYANKAKTIRDWMEKDRLRDEKFENTQPPKGIHCLACGSDMSVMMKNPHTDLEDYTKDRVSFMFECIKCKKRRIVWEDGENWELKIPCKKCGSETVKESNKREGNIITTIFSCLKCGYKEKDILDLDEKPKIEQEKPDPNFEKDRQKFCLSEKEGQEYIESVVRLDNYSKSMKEIKEKERIKKELVEIKKLTVADLQKLLSAALKKEEYINLELSKPEIKKDVIIEFTVQDNKTDRGEYDSRIQLQRILKKKLEATNWRLMSDGVSYRLGILSGRLRGYELEEDLLKLVKEGKK